MNLSSNVGLFLDRFLQRKHVQFDVWKVCLVSELRQAEVDRTNFNIIDLRNK